MILNDDSYCKWMREREREGGGREREREREGGGGSRKGMDKVKKVEMG